MAHLPMARVAAALVAVPLCLGLLAGCGRLSEVGAPPTLSAISDPTQAPGWRPLSMPMPLAEPVSFTPNSLWRPGARAFFRDQRASEVGDILTVVVNIGDSAVLNDGTTATRAGNQSLGIPDLFGLQSAISHALPKGADLTKVVSVAGSGAATGVGKIARDETVQLRVAGVVTQVLANGNLAVIGRQEVRVNSELRELLVSGIIRPQDIASDNTVQHDRMAEARVSYGGRGQLTDVQTARYGQQVLDIVAPF